MPHHPPRTSHVLRPATTAAALAAILAAPALASSHSDAPSIKLDPQANLTDLYAFVGTSAYDPSVPVLNVIASVRPFSEPGDGPHYDRFSHDAIYSLHLVHPATGAEEARYDFRFTPTTEGYKNTGTILSYGLGLEAGPIEMIDDARQNFTQRYTVSRVEPNGSTAILVDDAIVAPPNVGGNVTPAYNDADGRAVSGATDLAGLDDYTRQAIVTNRAGITVFAGPRDDAFFADVPGVFDLLDVRILDNDGDLSDGLGQDGDGVDGFKGFNVLTYAIQLPLQDLPSFTYDAPFFGAQVGLGVYASVSRPQVRELDPATGMPSASGPFVQVNRLGNPLFNEVLVPLAYKDLYNRTRPFDDAQFADAALQPEIAGLVNLLYGTAFQTEGRTDLAAVFLPDVLRVATTTGPVTLAGQAGFDRLGFIGGDLTGGVSSGWPNGRRPGDDVVDIALTAVASGPTYDPIVVVGDNVPSGDGILQTVFPYLATPNSGTNNRKDSTPGAPVVGDVDGDGDVDFQDLLMVLANFTAAG